MAFAEMVNRIRFSLLSGKKSSTAPQIIPDKVLVPAYILLVCISPRLDFKCFHFDVENQKNASSPSMPLKYLAGSYQYVVKRDCTSLSCEGCFHGLFPDSPDLSYVQYSLWMTKINWIKPFKQHGGIKPCHLWLVIV